MYTTKELIKVLGISEATLYKRFNQFDSLLKEQRRKGPMNNQNLITETGRKILERVEELRDDHLPIEAVKNQIKDELNQSQDGESTNTVNSTLNDLDSPEDHILYLKAENNQLKERLEDIKNQVANLERDKQQLYQVIQNRLPPSTQEVKSKLEDNMGRWERFKQFLKGE